MIEAMLMLRAMRLREAATLGLLVGVASSVVMIYFGPMRRGVAAQYRPINPYRKGKL